MKLIAYVYATNEVLKMKQNGIDISVYGIVEYDSFGGVARFMPCNVEFFNKGE